MNSPHQRIEHASFRDAQPGHCRCRYVGEQVGVLACLDSPRYLPLKELLRLFCNRQPRLPDAASEPARNALDGDFLVGVVVGKFLFCGRDTDDRQYFVVVRRNLDSLRTSLDVHMGVKPLLDSCCICTHDSTYAPAPIFKIT